MFTIMTGFAEFVRSLIAERVRAGMARAKKQGVHIGRPPAVNGEWPDYRRRLLVGEITQADAGRALGISRSTVCRMLQKGSGKAAPLARS